MTNSNVRCQAYELGELFWEHDRLALRALNDAQHKAQCRARERLHRHARLVQEMLQAGEFPAADPRQREAAAGMVDLTFQLWEHAREQDADAAVDPTPRGRLPIPAPASIWRQSALAPTVPAVGPASAHRERHDAAMVCRRCGMALERTELAVALDRPISQGWRHADGRKTHLPEPVLARTGPSARHR